MPFGLTNAPAAFQSYMNQLFHNLLDKYVVVYLDDILVYSRSWGEYEKHLRLILDRLDKNDLYIKGNKFIFFAKEIEYLGHIIG